MLGPIRSQRVRNAALGDLDDVQRMIQQVDNILDHNADEEDAIHADLVKAMNSLKRAQRKIRKIKVDRL